MQDPAQMDRRVRDVLALIAVRFPEPWSLAMFARHVDLSPAHLARLFGIATGTTLMAALKARRMAHAAELLCATQLTVKQIKFDVGFADDSHFVRDFEGIYGQSPANYRQARPINIGQ
jgi:AraC family transcriptional regulator of arabinose operon